MAQFLATPGSVGLFGRGLVAIALLALSVRGAAANEITFFTTVTNTDYVTSSIGLRDVGAGAMPVSGVTGPVTRAYLYWHGPTNSTNPLVNATVSFEGTTVTGANVGFSSDNFWGMANSQAYRADVTSLVTGNGSYDLANFQKSNAAVNGASLFVFFNDGNSANNRDFVMFNGNDANFGNAFDSAGWDMTLAGINYSGGSASLVTYVSDGQNFSPFDDGTLQVNGLPIATGGIFQGSSPKAPGAGVGNGSLTDLSTFNITSLLTVGANTLHVTLGPGVSDALSLIVAAVDLPAGAAPPTPGVPEPVTLLLLGMGLAATARRARRSRHS